jgi:hypothetical protein
MDGDDSQAAEYYERILRLRPQATDVAGFLAFIYATAPSPPLRQPARAVVLARQVVQATREQDAAAIGTLAIALAADGRLDEARVVAQRGVQLAQQTGRPAVAQDIARRMNAYFPTSNP